MATFNFSLKLSKEVFRGMGAQHLVEWQKESARKEIDQANLLIDRLHTDFQSRCESILKDKFDSAEDFKSLLRTLNFESLERNLEKLVELKQEKEDYLLSIDEQQERLKSIKVPVFSDDDYATFWIDHECQVYADHHLDIRGLESSKVDFYGVTKNKKKAFFILLELNRDAPESNVLKLYYYLKNSKTFWDYEDVVILQIFSPKYLVEKKGKSLALAREMAVFLGNEFSGHYSFGEQKIRMHYNNMVFGADQYEIYSVFWKLMSSIDADEEERFELMCKNLPGNRNFLKLCEKYVERETSRNREVNPAFLHLIKNQGTKQDILEIFRVWCVEVIQFIETNFTRFQEQETLPASTLK